LPLYWIETSAAIAWLKEVIGACLSTCLELHVGGNLYSLGARTVEIDGAPNWKDISLPFFIEIADQQPVPSERIA
jgi:hypothetical protein